MPPRLPDEARLKEMLFSALAFARTKVDYADVLCERVTRIELQQLSDRLISKPFNAKSRVQLRLLSGGKKAEIKVGTLSPEPLRTAIVNGTTLLQALPEPERPVRLAPIPNPNRVTYGHAAPRRFPAAIIFKALLQGISNLARQCESRHAARRLEIKPEFWFFSQREEKVIADSEGVFKTQVMPRTFLQLLTRVKGPDGRLTQTRARLGLPLSYDSLFRRKQKGLVLAPATARHIIDWLEKTVELQDAITLSPEQISEFSHLVLHYTTIGVFVHEALGHNFEADIVRAGGSGIIDRDGKPRGEVASEDINILDGPLNGNFRLGFGTEYIDDEGVEVQTKELARNGRVTGMILDRETAAHFNLPPNGGAFSEMGDQRIPRMSNTYLLPASRHNWYRTLEQLIGDVKKGIVLIGTSGGAVSRDGMSSSVLIGRLIENGRITKTVRPSNFSAKTLHALRYVDAFAGPISIDDAGFCGKGQTRYVGDGGPTWTRIRNNEFVSLSVQG
ncbi:MAG: TldD/PmbA family protein [candidate division WOR-3 bacterium]